MRNKILFIVMMGLSAGVIGTAQAGDAAAGKAKSAMCAGCHGANGISLVPTTPNLAGQQEAYFVKAVKAYKDGSRKDPMMGGLAKGLSDSDIDNLAAYYNSLK